MRRRRENNKIVEKGIKTLRENNKIVEEGMKKLRREIIKLWRRRREIKMIIIQCGVDVGSM